MFKKMLVAMGLAGMLLAGFRGNEYKALAAEEYTYDVFGSVEVTASDMLADGSYDITVSWDLGENYLGHQVWAKAFVIFGDANKFSKAFASADKGTATYNFSGSAGKYIYRLRTSEGDILGQVTIGGGADAEYQAVIDERINKWVTSYEDLGDIANFEDGWLANSANAEVSIPSYGTVIEDYEKIAVPKTAPVYENDGYEGPTDEEMQKAIEESEEIQEEFRQIEEGIKEAEQKEAEEAAKITETPVEEVVETPVEEAPYFITIAPKDETEDQVDVVETPDVVEPSVDVTEVPEVKEPTTDVTENNSISDVADEVLSGTSDVKVEKTSYTVPAIVAVIGVCFIVVFAIIIANDGSKKRG